ncbi:MAG: DUF4105 domain-containing protein [Magnetococcales bacterium]|nr:DUF4105 domain-containing protein [Magnetococcales bacterium]
MVVRSRVITVLCAVFSLLSGLATPAVSAPAVAAPAVSAPAVAAIHDDILARNDPATLARSPVWLKLLHYEEDLLPGSDPVSAITSDAFFLSPDGKHDAQAELTATLAAILAPVTGNPDEHARCRFPARTLWLMQQFALSEQALPPMACSDYQTWLKAAAAESLSILFVNGYLSNPASFYGHILLKFNSRNDIDTARTALEDLSINYGAIVPEGVNPLSYIFNGVFGGYEGGFSHIQFYFHNHNYGERELRDMWEYQLDLPQEQVDFIVAHLWELQRRTFTYYFFQQNCAFRIATLVELINGITVRPSNPIFTMPFALVNGLTTATVNGKPLVREVVYHPSRQTRLTRRYSGLSATQKAQVRQEIARLKVAESDEVSSDYAVIDTLLDYYQFLEKAERDDSAKAQEAYRKVLAHRYRLPPHPIETLNIQRRPPHLSRKGSRLGIGGVHSSRYGAGVELHLRPAYYDPLDADTAHVRNSALSMFDLTLRLYDNAVSLESLEFLTIENANPDVTGLPEDSNSGWKIQAGLERPRLGCSDCLTPRLQGAVGRAYALTESLTLTPMVGSALRWPRGDQSLIDAKGSLRALLTPTENLSLQLTTTVAAPLFDTLEWYRRDSAEARLRLQENHDLRLRYRQDDQASDLSLGFGLYW